MLTFLPRWIDLTHPVYPGVPVFPGDPECTFTPHAELVQDGYRVTRLCCGTHLGTHLDAPSHFLPDGAPVDLIPLEHLCGPAVLLDLSHKGAPKSVIDASDLEPFADRLVPGARALIRTGWDVRFGTEAFFNDQPGFTPEACRWLAARRLRLLGLDVPSLHPALFAPTHVPLLQAGTVIVESLRLTPLCPYAAGPIAFFAAPLPLRGLDGSPVRAFAAVPGTYCEDEPAKPPAVHVEVVTSATQMLDALAIREAVFVDEQGVDWRLERDAADRTALHLLAYRHGEPAGTLRLLVRDAGEVAIGRFAVLRAHRGQGVGRALMEWVLIWARDTGVAKLTLHAQVHAAGFYRRFGFEVCGPQFIEAGILHVPMERDVND